MFSIVKLALFVAAAAAALVSADPIGSMPEMPEVRSLGEFSTRATPMVENKLLGKRDGELYCGNFASAGFKDAHTMWMNLKGGTQYTAAAHGCKRVRCRNTSGIYFCNDRNTPLTLTADQINAHTFNIFDRCCIHLKNGKEDSWQTQSGGQQFTDAFGGNWNVIVAYANCNHPDTRIPSSYNGGTVNGAGCQSASMYIS